MKRFLGFIALVFTLSFFPGMFFIGYYEEKYTLYASGIASVIILVASYAAMYILTADDYKKKDKSIHALQDQLDSEKRYAANLMVSLDNAKKEISDFEQTVILYKKKFGLLNELNAKIGKKEVEYRKFIDDYSQNLEKELSAVKEEKIKSIEWYVGRRYEILQKEEQELSKKIHNSQEVLKSLNDEVQNLCKSDVESFYRQVAVILFPDNPDKIDEMDISSADFTALRSQVYKRLKIVSYYTSLLEDLKLALTDKKYSPYIYTTLAEAYSNKIIADYYRQNYNQNEIFQPVARISAELQNLYLRCLEHKLDWGKNAERAKKVESIRTLRKETNQKIEEANYSRYQLEYLLGLYPQLQDVLDIDYKDLGVLRDDFPSEDYHDSTRDYLSKEEYNSLSEIERNQLALDRYIASHSKTKWQIGRDYEMYIGYMCEKNNMKVDYTGSRLKFEDLGRDLIAEDLTHVYIIQCKYWSKDKLIHEKHIMQLFGTIMEYTFTQKNAKQIIGVFVTSTRLSEMAKHFAEELKIMVFESIPMGQYPLIKCNINKDEYGVTTYIYHLPMDLSYDVTKIDSPGEFMAFTVREAEEAGFRRSYKYHGGFNPS